MKTEKSGLLQHRLPQQLSLREILTGSAKMLFAALLAALLCGPAAGQDKRPLCLAFLIACPDPYSAAAMVGCLAAYWLGGIGADFAAYLAACGVVSALRWLLTGLRPCRDTKALFRASCIAAACSLSVTRLAVAALLQRPPAAALLSLAWELAAVTALAFCFRCGLLTARQLKNGLAPNLLNATASAAALCCVSAAACKWSTGLLAAGHILAAFGAAAGCFCLPMPLGSVFCAAAAAGCMLAEPQFAFGVAGIMAAGCMVLPVRNSGKGVSAVFFLLPAALLCAAAPGELYGAVYLTELLCGTLLFLLLPLPQVKPAAAAVSTNSYLQATAAARQKLESACEGMADIGRLLARTLPNPVDFNRGEMLAACVERVCRSCPAMSDCWLKHYDDTAAALGKAADKLVQSGTLSKQQFQREMHERCICAGRLHGEMCDSYTRSVTAAREQRSAVICREVLKEQFDAAAGMLQSIRMDMERMGSWDEEKSRRLCERCVQLALQPVTVYCADSPADGCCVRICLKENPREEQLKELAAAASAVMGTELQPGKAKKVSRGWSIALQPVPRFSLQTAAAQHSANRSVCGDVYSIFENDADSSCHLLLCDGMGTGSAAAQDGALSCSLLCRLLTNGFDAHAAARLVNAVFSLRQDTETACTLDLCSFFRCSGEMRLMKAGAAASYVLHGGELLRFDGRTLPVGILDKVFCSSSTLQLQPGDMVLLMSDGFDEHGALAGELLQRHSKDSPDVLCRALLQQARQQGLRDDATVLAAKVTQHA